MFNNDIMYAVMQDRAANLQAEARVYRQAKSVSVKHRRRLIARRPH